MLRVSRVALDAATKSVRSEFRHSEDSFGDDILTEIAIKLWPAPNTAAKIASEVGCSVRNIEFCLEGTQKWSGDAVAVIVAEIMRRHRMRNFKVTKRE